MGLFSLGRRRDSETAITSRHIAGQVRTVLQLGEDDAVTVSQIDCGDPACAGGAETVILVMRKGHKTRAAKISKAMSFVADEDVAEAVRLL
ncbi:hypothetical protein [Flaviflagellibacter deserti]|uniref:Ethanolamine utilization protein EutN n=1 Tax=Flaviflagellibacter deserti TaxID=2267266 RepID=A0ABV9YWL7_9HYPH